MPTLDRPREILAVTKFKGAACPFDIPGVLPHGNELNRPSGVIGQGESQLTFRVYLRQLGTPELTHS
jgi:hypothetical protein